MDGQVPERLQRWPFGQPGELSRFFTEGGLEDVTETTLRVESSYADVEELWSSFMLAIGPAGLHLASLSPHGRERLRTAYLARVGSPDGAFTLAAVAHAAVGTVPGH